MSTFADHVTAAGAHTRKAEELLEQSAQSHWDNSPTYTAQAQAHATLALAHLELAKLAPS